MKNGRLAAQRPRRVKGARCSPAPATEAAAVSPKGRPQTGRPVAPGRGGNSVFWGPCMPFWAQYATGVRTAPARAGRGDRKKRGAPHVDEPKGCRGGTSSKFDSQAAAAHPAPKGWS